MEMRCNTKPRRGENGMSLATFEMREVKEFTRVFESLFNEGDAEGMASYYAEDARLLAEDTEPILGRRAIEQFWQGTCTGARAAKVRRTINLEEVTASGNLGYALGTVDVHIPWSGEQGRDIIFKYATIWRREVDGRWRLAIDISNRNPG
jgi:uncharacterized protein (TIGR02246 family)